MVRSQPNSWMIQEHSFRRCDFYSFTDGNLGVFPSGNIPSVKLLICTTFQMRNFPNLKLPQMCNFPKVRPSKASQDATGGRALRLGRMGQGQTWEVAALEIAQLGSCHLGIPLGSCRLGKSLWESI